MDKTVVALNQQCRSLPPEVWKHIPSPRGVTRHTGLKLLIGSLNMFSLTFEPYVPYTMK